jgi:hypothetical protein
VGEDSPDSSETPLCWDGEAVLVPFCRFEHPREDRAADASKRGYQVDVHRVRLDGSGTCHSFQAASTLICQSWSFLRLGGDLVLHVGSFHAMPEGQRLTELPYVDASCDPRRPPFLEHQGSLFFCDRRKPRVYCHDVASKESRWMVELPQRGSAGPLALHGGHLVCHRVSGLGYLDPATGRLEREQTFAGTDRLYAPVEHEGDLLFAYTSGSGGGLLRFDPTENRIKWKFSKKGAAANPRGPVPVVGRTAILAVNDGSSLIGVDLDSGQARWSFRAQWLYTPIEVAGSSIIFGTAGGHGRHLRRHDAATGDTEWAVQIDGGCPYYTRQDELLVVGDRKGVLRRVRPADGVVVDELKVGGPITTAPLVVGAQVFTLRWPTKYGASPALVAVAT